MLIFGGVRFFLPPQKKRQVIKKPYGPSFDPSNDLWGWDHPYLPYCSNGQILRDVSIRSKQLGFFYHDAMRLIHETPKKCLPFTRKLSFQTIACLAIGIKFQCSPFTNLGKIHELEWNLVEFHQCFVQPWIGSKTSTFFAGYWWWRFLVP